MCGFFANFFCYQNPKLFDMEILWFFGRQWIQVQWQRTSWNLDCLVVKHFLDFWWTESYEARYAAVATTAEMEDLRGKAAFLFWWSWVGSCSYSWLPAKWRRLAQLQWRSAGRVVWRWWTVWYKKRHQQLLWQVSHLSCNQRCLPERDWKHQDINNINHNHDADDHHSSTWKHCHRLEHCCVSHRGGFRGRISLVLHNSFVTRKIINSKHARSSFCATSWHHRATSWPPSSPSLHGWPAWPGVRYRAWPTPYLA